ncbi:hypothetical protein Scep_003277 [Stephania cephalantha]|uniref:Uncharacterized protein n=1 Tax=Stephania cephalantha TaxID=152367 RepID=A0AAP0KQ71_9MAGN
MARQKVVVGVLVLALLIAVAAMVAGADNSNSQGNQNEGNKGGDDNQGDQGGHGNQEDEGESKGKGPKEKPNPSEGNEGGPNGPNGPNGPRPKLPKEEPNPPSKGGSEPKDKPNPPIFEPTPYTPPPSQPNHPPYTKPSPSTPTGEVREARVDMRGPKIRRRGRPDLLLPRQEGPRLLPPLRPRPPHKRALHRAPQPRHETRLHLGPIPRHPLRLTPRFHRCAPHAAANRVAFEVHGKFRITVTVTPITEEESRVHNYGITKDDCFAHLDLGFKLYSLSDEVSGVLGQNYGPNYVSRVNVRSVMPVLGGFKEFVTTGLFEADCAVAQFGRGHGDTSVVDSELEYASMRCGSGNIHGRGIVCKK